MSISVHEAANNILSFLYDHHQTDIINELLYEFDNDEDKVRSIADSAEKLGNKHWGFDPLGVYIGSTTALLEKCNLVDNEFIDDSVGKDAIKLLKDTKRLKQCGGGKGKAVILLSNAPFLEEAEGTVEQQVELTPITLDEISEALGDPVNIHHEVSFDDIELDCEYNEVCEPTQLSLADVPAKEYLQSNLANSDIGHESMNKNSIIDLLRDATDEFRELKSQLDESYKSIDSLKNTITYKDEVISELETSKGQLLEQIQELENTLAEKRVQEHHTWS